MVFVARYGNGIIKVVRISFYSQANDLTKLISHVYVGENIYLFPYERRRDS